MDLIILAGMPATGKSTVAAALSRALGYPILEKDAIKEELFDTLGFEDYPRKRALDHAANAALLRVLQSMLEAGTSVIVDNNFDTGSAQRLSVLLEAYRPNCVTVFLGGEPQVLYKRYAQRDDAGKRHLGHVLQLRYPPQPGDPLHYTMTPEEFEEKFFKRGMAQFRCPGKRMDVDTTDFAKVSPEAICTQVRQLLAQPEGGNT